MVAAHTCTQLPRTPAPDCLQQQLGPHLKVPYLLWLHAFMHACSFEFHELGDFNLVTDGHNYRVDATFVPSGALMRGLLPFTAMPCG